MTRRKRPGEWAIVYAELPPPLVDWLKARAKGNLRSMTTELRAILEDVQRKELRKK